MTKEKQQSPFQFGTLATRDNFIDRVEDRALLKTLLASHINVMLISPRRWGKSSLVKKTMEEMQAADSKVRVCFIDAFSIASEAEFYRVFASRVIACASTRRERWVADAKKFLSGVVPRIVVNDQVTDFLAFDLRYVPQEQDKLAILQLPERLAEEKGLHIIVCIDEFQQLALLPNYKDMEGKMRATWQQHTHANYCLYGSKRHMMLGIFNNSSSPFYRFGQVIFMQKIKKADWLPFIVSAFQRTGKRISQELAGEICDVVKCHSWYLQQLCYFVWSATDVEADTATLDYALRQLLNINMPMFQNDTDNLTPSQREMLHAVCNGETRLSAEETKAKYALGNPNTIARNKRILQDKDIIEKDAAGRWTFVDPIYELWYRQQTP